MAGSAEEGFPVMGSAEATGTEVTEEFGGGCPFGGGAGRRG